MEKCVLSQESRGSCGSHIALFAACRWHLRGSSNDSSGRQAGGLSVRVWLVAQCSSAVSVACTESGRPPNACATAAIPRRYRIPPSPPPPGVAVHQAPLSYMYVPRRSSVLAPVRTAFDIARVGPGVEEGCRLLFIGRVSPIIPPAGAYRLHRRLGWSKLLPSPPRPLSLCATPGTVLSAPPCFAPGRICFTRR